LGFIAESIFLMKRNKFAEAAKLLEAHVNDPGLKPASRIGIMAWIGECYVKGEELQSAGNWFEKAGRAALSCQEMAKEVREKRAVSELDQAISYYEAVDDIKGMSRAATLKYSILK
jgi:Tfp pilus assembly protein PilF